MVFEHFRFKMYRSDIDKGIYRNQPQGYYNQTWADYDPPPITAQPGKIKVFGKLI